MTIVLFAIIGAALNMGPWYWVCFGFHCAFKIIKAIWMFCMSIAIDEL